MRVPHPCAFCAQEPALSEAAEVGFHGSVRQGFLHLRLHLHLHVILILILLLGGAAVHRCDKCPIFSAGFSR